MRFEATPLPGAWVIELDLLGDERGWFARAFDAREFQARGLDPCAAQGNLSFNARRDTIRGMHYQAAPEGEPKLVRCVRGAIFDVALDLRPTSRAYRAWHGIELSAENRRAFYLPPGMAHGFQTLTGDCEVLYQMGHPHVPEAARGVRWNDPAFAIAWPPSQGERTISARDRAYPDFQPGGPRQPTGPGQPASPGEPEGPE
jgi:dTDP-4-dehydrorhamnose 3,5-epimerase